jgi:hypothetical protein
MQAVLAQHSQAEMEADVDGAMIAISPKTVVELYPLGIRITGLGAIREMYKRIDEPLISKMLSSDESPRITTAYGDGVIMAECEAHCPTPQGSAIVRSAWVGKFEGDKLVGDYLYTDSVMAEQLRRVLGEDFTELPGVSLLGGTWAETS